MPFKYKGIENPDWIKQFIDMIFPLNRNQLDIDGAYNLKNKHLPKSVFKYREVNGVSLKNLEEDTVRLSDPSNFNDPYDCAHTINFAQIMQMQSSASFEKFIQERWSDLNLSSEQKKSLAISPDLSNDLLEICLSGVPFEKREDIKSVLISLQEERGQNLAVAFSKLIANSFKLCSFSERNDSVLMWAHYASNHQGFCVEYDLEKIPHKDFRRRFMYPVIYDDKMFDATEHFIKVLEGHNFNVLYWNLVALVKASDWGYEKEWRLVFSNGLLESERLYGMGKPKTVFFGTKISDSDQDLLIKICERRKIPYVKMKIHHSMYKMVPCSLKDS
jgi:hypothetical protein